MNTKGTISKKINVSFISVLSDQYLHFPYFLHTSYIKILTRVSQKFCNILLEHIYGFYYNTGMTQKFFDILLVRVTLQCLYHVTKPVQTEVSTQL